MFHPEWHAAPNTNTYMHIPFAVMLSKEAKYRLLLQVLLLQLLPLLLLLLHASYDWVPFAGVHSATAIPTLLVDGECNGSVWWLWWLWALRADGRADGPYGCYGWLWRSNDGRPCTSLT